MKKKTTQWPKETVQKDKQRTTKHTHKTKDRVTRSPLKTRFYLTFLLNQENDLIEIMLNMIFSDWRETSRHNNIYLILVSRKGGCDLLMKVIPETLESCALNLKSMFSLLSLGPYLCWWTISPVCIRVSFSALTWFIRYIYYFIHSSYVM